MSAMDVEAESAISVVKAEDHSFELGEESLKSILLADEIKDKKVVVVSVAGAFRKGKSFMLNFMLRYLEAQGRADWLGADDKPLKGFSWRGGSERDTTGILMWNKVFLVKLPSDEEVAVVLMDTQGAFDSSSTVRECATVFALSTMLSSIQVYNLSQNIQEDDLQHLELFAEYGRLALEDTHETPFQKLVFLVRDWSYPYDAQYGPDGGSKILGRRLEISDRQHPQLQQLRRHIKSCFSEVSCFLMPHPGFKVSTNPEFDGRLADIMTEFKDMLQIFVPNLLAPENLIPKKIGGRCITAKELITYFKSYIEIFKGDGLPEPKSMLQATAEANNLSAMADAKEIYNSTMEAICGGTCPYINDEELEKKHIDARENALRKFVSTRRMGGEELTNEYMEKLRTELEEMYTSFMRFNDGKKITNALRTPATLLCIILFSIVNSYLMNALSLTSFTFFSNLLCGVSVIALGLWIYSRYSGELHQLSQNIDFTIAYIIINFVLPSQRAIMDRMSDAQVREAHMMMDNPGVGNSQNSTQPGSSGLQPKSNSPPRSGEAYKRTVSR